MTATQDEVRYIIEKQPLLPDCEHRKMLDNVSEDASTAPRLFADILNRGGLEGAGRLGDISLTNVTLWAGAGFSKSWDPRAPIGSELFTISPDLIDMVTKLTSVHALDIVSIFELFGIDPKVGITPNQLRQAVFQIDMYERHPDVRSRYIDDQNLRMLRSIIRAMVIKRFTELSTLNYFDSDRFRFPLLTPTSAQNDIVGLFRAMLCKPGNNEPLTNGIRANFLSTNYDYVIETILDNMTPEDDAVFRYAYRGFTPRRIMQTPPLSPVHSHRKTLNLLKINGGFEIYNQEEDYILDYSFRSARDIMAKPPIIILPSREQDYTDPYFRMIFPKAVRLLRESSVLMIVGYSLPEDDALIRFIIKQFAEHVDDGRGKLIFYISPDEDSYKRTVVKDVFPATDTDEAPKLVTYQGSFANFANECLTFLSA